MEKVTQKYSGGNTEPPRARSWTFTSYEQDPPIYDEVKMKFLAYGKETCPSTQKSHFQGFVYMKDAKTLSSMKKSIGNTLHFEVMKGTLEQNIKYCSKEGELKEFGKRPAQGERKDLEEIKNEIIAGKKVDEIVLENPLMYHMYGRTLHKIEDIALRSKYRKEMTKGIWYYGKTGSGKSHKAFENFDPSKCYVLPNDNGWWDGYVGQETVIINDFRGEIRYNEMLQLVDKWPFSVKRRGREPLPFISKLVIITSSLEPKKIYRHREEEDNIEQLLRRFEVIEV